MRAWQYGVVLLVVAVSLFLLSELKILWAVAGVLFLVAVLFLLYATVRVFFARFLYLRKERRIRERDATTESPLEKTLAAELDARHIPYEREYQISNIHADFAFPKKKLVVECDGWRYHHGRSTQDAKRDQYLRSQGWTVLRFNGNQLRKSSGACVDEIVRHL